MFPVPQYFGKTDERAAEEERPRVADYAADACRADPGVLTVDVPLRIASTFSLPSTARARWRPRLTWTRARGGRDPALAWRAPIAVGDNVVTCGLVHTSARRRDPRRLALPDATATKIMSRSAHRRQDQHGRFATGSSTEHPLLGATKNPGTPSASPVVPVAAGCGC